MYPDPIFETFPEKEKKIKNYKYAPQSYLTINGRIQMPDINVLRKEDIRVKIGAGICNVTSGKFVFENIRIYLILFVPGDSFRRLF